MKNIFIEATALTPQIVLNTSTGEFSIVGKSYPEDGLVFYKFMLDYVDELIHTNIETFTLKFDLEYANTSSAKSFISIIYKMQQLPNAKVIWIHEKDDDQILELGTDIAELVSVPFEFKIKKIR
jgi:SiaC family regulatory phosphoprotein